ncbi:fatty-acid--CoA ligase FadD1 [Mycolicibacterium vaccae]|uniref:Acyl-CoA synthetase n=1 Tax=Mycolicibacterium vaccae ATCC 25954 TaxID=1194972 RepID=K0VJ76_MYCVA|nr:fatty-acid--CoA ligase FadD1 [Mycolicibacterium vaccae]ANI41258.1 acyl-CoA synthetase [Mycolicibacterium vaccae 95051]EJZ11179.1 acyl-CoA synthetase [Mycolicibacterium vaccae ATCC 25954]MCV7063785.1 AMP-binding protein [Mycolicibacterium vaccae]
MTETVQQLLRERVDSDGIAVTHEGRTWTWREHLDQAAAQAAALIGAADPDRPLHVGVLLGNTPDMLTAMAAAGLGGYVVCGINNTRRGESLARDIRRADCQFLLTDGSHRGLLDGLDLTGVRVFEVGTPEWTALTAQAGPLTPHREVTATDTFMLIFTSGTSGDPKAVKMMHAMVLLAGAALVSRYQLSPDDVCYLSMPLFHSNAVLAGWAVAVNAGAAMAPAQFSASRFLDDVRRYGVTYMNYVGKPLAYILARPERPDDVDNPLRVAFGNEATDRDIAEFSRRFGCQVWDGFGSTENAVTITREDGCPPGSIGKGFPGVAIYHSETRTECAVARFDEHGALCNADDAIGELVNTQGAGMFAGYYNDPDATDDRMRHGMFWSGDLAYRDADGWIYLAGRTADWMRVDGENLTAAPIERILIRQPAVSMVAVYPVPDEFVGDQVMAAIVLQDDATLTPDEFARFLDEQPDLSPKAWPRHVWVAEDLPSTATNKVLKRELVAMGTEPAGRTLWRRDGKTYLAVAQE